MLKLSEQTTLRNANDDKLKSKELLASEKTKKCKVPGCKKGLTKHMGPGQHSVCREHQLMLREYGGPGRLDRMHTFHRKNYCEDCGYNPWEDKKWQHYHYKVDNPMLFSRLCRNKLIGDHQHRKCEGGEDTAKNIRTLCLNCNSDKTIIAEDYL